MPFSPVNRDNGHFSASGVHHQLSYIVNPALRTRITCALCMNEYLTSVNLTVTANDLSKFLSNNNRVIVLLLRLVQRQAKVKTTRYTIQLVICAPFPAVSLNISLEVRFNSESRRFFWKPIFGCNLFCILFLLLPSTFSGAHVRTSFAYTYLRPWPIRQHLSIGRLTTPSNLAHRNYFRHFLKLAA